MTAATSDMAYVLPKKIRGRIARRLWVGRIMAAIAIPTLCVAIVEPPIIAAMISIVAMLVFMTSLAFVGEARSVRKKVTQDSDRAAAWPPVGRRLNHVANIGMWAACALSFFSLHTLRDDKGDYESEHALRGIAEGLAVTYEKSGALPASLADVPDHWERMDSEERAFLDETIEKSQSRREWLRTIWPMRGDREHFSNTCVYFPIKGFSKKGGIEMGDVGRILVAASENWPPMSNEGHDQVIVAFARKKTVPPERHLWSGRRRYVLLADCEIVTADDSELAELFKKDAAMRRKLGWPVYTWKPGDQNPTLVSDPER